MPLFELPPFRWPTWYTPTKGRPRSNARVARGRHPNGRELGPEGSTCGACVHLVERHRGRTYAKCPITLGQSMSTASDLVRSWRGCDLFDWRCRRVGIQLPMLGLKPADVTACGRLVAYGSAEPVEPDPAPSNSGFANVVDPMPITCPACLELER